MREDERAGDGSASDSEKRLEESASIPGTHAPGKCIELTIVHDSSLQSYVTPNCRDVLNFASPES